ncbi:hypothetical protein BJY04DRAFT_219991 [Aspergillus karnatakaensis]|uniref:uncharacterized protein n=1 Tax=Aspergillus karnatakaensis TaxID=1810916 RepID=UPI003CCD5470
MTYHPIKYESADLAESFTTLTQQIHSTSNRNIPIVKAALAKINSVHSKFFDVWCAHYNADGQNPHQPTLYERLREVQHGLLINAVTEKIEELKEMLANVKTAGIFKETGLKKFIHPMPRVQAAGTEKEVRALMQFMDEFGAWSARVLDPVLGAQKGWLREFAVVDAELALREAAIKAGKD